MDPTQLDDRYAEVGLGILGMIPISLAAVDDDLPPDKHGQAMVEVLARLGRRVNKGLKLSRISCSGPEALGLRLALRVGMVVGQLKPKSVRHRPGVPATGSGEPKLRNPDG